jgi:SAM-dependent methyltransferase
MRRIMILLLTLLWGMFVFLPGSVLVKDAALRAAFAVLPLFIAALLVADGGSKWRIYIRRLYAVLLAMFGVFIWGGLSLTPYVLGATILLWPEIRGCLPRGNRRLLFTGGALIFVILVPFIWWQWFHNPLPSDKELIEHFNAHRAEFEQLAKGHRNHRDQDKFYELSSQEVQSLMKKAGVNRIVEAGGSFSEWFPEPYSEHTLQVRKSLNVRPIENRATEEETMATYRRELPALFEGVAPLRGELDVALVTSPIQFCLGPEPGRSVWWKKTLRYFGSFLNKGFCYYPQIPRVENGHIIDTGYMLRDNSYTRPGLRVFDSLDDYPPNWKGGECVVKKLDHHWYIFMCRNTP